MTIPVTPAPRIRWEPTDSGGFTGHVGTLEPCAFTIWKYNRDVAWWTLTGHLGAMRDCPHGDDPDELKAEAERWLEQFVRSLGAVFPEGECPECGFRPPTHTHDKNCSRYAPDTAATAGEAE